MSHADPPIPPGYGGGSGGGGGDSTGGSGTGMGEVSREELKDKIALAEAKSDARFATMIGEMKLTETRLLNALEKLPSKREMFFWHTTVFVIALAVVAAFYAAVTLTESRYLGLLARIPVTVQSQPVTQSADQTKKP